MRPLASLILPVVIVPLACGVLRAGPTIALHMEPVQEEMHWQGWAPSGQVVEVNNVHGNVRAVETPGDEIEVIALKRGASDPRRVSIEVVEHKGGVTICAVYPSAHADHPYECRPSHGRGFRASSISDSQASIRWDNGGGGDVVLNDMRVDFLVRVPKGLRFIGRTVEGEISTRLFDQDVEAHSIRGDVNVEMKSFEGAEVRAETGMGELDSDIPIAVHSDRSGALFAEGHFGRPHRTVRLKTDVGTIRLQRTATF